MAHKIANAYRNIMRMVIANSNTCNIDRKAFDLAATEFGFVTNFIKKQHPQLIVKPKDSDICNISSIVPDDFSKECDERTLQLILDHVWVEPRVYREYDISKIRFVGARR